VRIVIAPTVREPDGLALSSRNRYLTAAERPAASVLHAALSRGAALAAAGERAPTALLRAMTAVVAAERNARLDHFAIVDANDLTPLGELDRPAAFLGALWIGETRLIDNVLVSPPTKGRKRT
jgi:pantoate--beta-alanine ligase